MLSLETTGQFRRDYKRIKKRGYDTKLLEDIIQTLLEEKPLPLKHRDPFRSVPNVKSGVPPLLHT